MAKNTTINLDVKTNIPKVDKDIKNLNKSLTTTDDTIEDIGKTSKKTEKEVKKLGRSASKSMKKGAKETTAFNVGMTGITSTTRLGVQALQTYEGAMALVGAESEEVEVVLKNLMGVMALAQGVEGMINAGKSFLNFVNLVKTGSKAVRVALISTGIGALVIGVASLIAYWEDLTGWFTKAKNSMGAFGKAVMDVLEFVMKPFQYVIELVIDGLQYLGVLESDEEIERKKRAKAQAKRHKEWRQSIKDEIEQNKFLSEQRKRMDEALIGDLERELKLRQANGQETLALEKQILEEKSAQRTKDLEDAEKNYELELELLEDSIKSKKSFIDAFQGTMFDALKKQAEKELKELEAQVEEEKAILQKAQEEEKNAINEVAVFSAKTNLEEEEDKKESYQRRIQARKDFDNEIRQMDIELMKEGIEQTRAEIENDYKLQREDILANEEYNRTQKAELIKKLDQLEKKQLLEAEIEYNQEVQAIEDEITELRLANIQNQTERELKELEFKYEQLTKEILDNEEYTEQQKTELLKEYAKQRELEVRAIELEANKQRLNDQLVYNEARQLQETENFEKTLELQLEQAEIERDLALEQDNLTANEKFLIQEQYQAKVTKLTEDAEKERQDIQKAFISAGFDIAKQSLDFLSLLNDQYAGEDEKKKKEQFEINKKIQIAGALVSSAQGVVNILASSTAPLPLPIGQIYKGIQVGLLAGTTALQIAKIKATQFESSGTGGGTSGATGGGAGASVISPEFNVVGDSGINQLEGLGQQPIEAYVVSGSVTTAQSLDRNRIENATL